MEPRVLAVAAPTEGSVLKLGAVSGRTSGQARLIDLSGRVILRMYSVQNVTRSAGETTIKDLQNIAFPTWKVTAKGSIPFSVPGDSGSWIFDSENRFVGLLWGGSKRSNSDSTYFAPITSIMPDIEARLAGDWGDRPLAWFKSLNVRQLIHLVGF
jgi:hypothetical protein